MRTDDVIKKRETYKYCLFKWFPYRYLSIIRNKYDFFRISFVIAQISIYVADGNILYIDQSLAIDFKILIFLINFSWIPSHTFRAELKSN